MNLRAGLGKCELPRPGVLLEEWNPWVREDRAGEYEAAVAVFGQCHRHPGLLCPLASGKDAASAGGAASWVPAPSGGPVGCQYLATYCELGFLPLRDGGSALLLNALCVTNVEGSLICRQRVS